MRNEITAVPFSRKGKQVELSLTMEPNESVLLVFQPKQRALPPRREPGSGAGHKTIAVTRDPTPAQPEPQPPIGSGPALALKGCSWTWYPEGDSDASRRRRARAISASRSPFLPGRRSAKPPSPAPRTTASRSSSTARKPATATTAPKAGAIRWNWT